MSTVTPMPTVTLSPADPDALYEIIDGRYVEKGPVGILQLGLANEIADLLKQIPQVRATGKVYPEMIFDLRPGTFRSRRPDVAFVSFDRWSADRPLDEVYAWAVIPDLAIEIVSPTNTSVEIKEKTHESLAAGARQVWVDYPETCEVECHDSPTSVRIVETGGVLDVSALWPGVVIEVERLLALPRSGRP